MADVKTYSLGQDGKYEVKIGLFKSVKNAVEVKRKVLKGQLQGAVLRPKLVRGLVN